MADRRSPETVVSNSRRTLRAPFQRVLTALILVMTLSSTMASSDVRASGAASIGSNAITSAAAINFPAVHSALRRYPYLTDLVDGYATINWATDRSGAEGSAKWGQVATNDSCVPTNTVDATRTSITVGSVSQYQWKANLTLSASTQYCYRVFLGTTDLLGSNASPRFWTQVPAGSSEAYSFLVIGDWGEVDSAGNNTHQANVLQQMAATDARFVVTTGDNAYPDASQTNFGDLVQKGADKGAIFGPAFWPNVGDSMALFTTMGNHGYNRSETPHPHLGSFPQDRVVATSGGRYVRETYCCKNGTRSANYPSTWYAFTVGNSRFYVLDAVWTSGNSGSADPYKNDYDYHWAPGTPQYQWLENDLANNPEPVKFVFFHYPMYSDNATESSHTRLQGPNSIEGLLGRYGVDIAFNGHAHIYQRNRPNSDGFMTYLTGGGGARLQPIGAGGCSANDAYGIGWSYSSNNGTKCGAASTPSSIDRVYHFLKVTVSGAQVTVTPTDSMGRAFDAQTYFFGGSGDTEPPTAPTDLRVTANTATAVNLGWTAATDNVGVTSYAVYRNGTSVAAGVTQTSYSDTSVADNTTYTYTVRARDASGNLSPPSNAVTITTPDDGRTTLDPIVAVEDAAVQASSPTTNYGSALTLLSDSSPIEESYLKFDVTGVSGAVTDAMLRLWVVNGSNDGPDIFATSNGWSESTITWNTRPTRATTASAGVGAVTAGNWVEYDVTSLVSGNGTVSLALASTSSDGTDLTSSEGTAANRPQLVVTFAAPTDTESPSVPQDLTATATSPTAIDLTWTASTDNVGVTNYEITRDGSVLTTIGNQTTYMDTTVNPDTTYTYSVTAIDAAGNRSAASDTASDTTPTPPPDTSKPTMPTDLTAIAASSTQVNLSWTASTDNVAVTNYEIYRDGSLLTTVNTDTTHADTTVVASTTYDYTVRARDAAGNLSDFSTPADATTPGSTPTTLPPILPIEDVHVQASNPTTNYGAALNLLVDASSAKESYLKFNVTGATGTITNATLRLWVTDASPDGPEVYATSNGWSESSMTWNTRPARSTTPTDSKARVTVGTFIEYNVTALVSANGTVSFALATASADGTDFTSREGTPSTNRPQLVITVNGGP